MGERACLLLKGQRVLPEKMGMQHRFAYPHLADALRDLLHK
jgi:NAD dependent epimerase/dehydratase family enzyme